MLAVVVTLVVALDFLLGPQKRKALREKVGEWWIYVDDSSFRGLVVRDAALVRRLLQTVFGDRWFRLRRVTLSAVVSLLLTLSLAWWISHRVIDTACACNIPMWPGMPQSPAMIVSMIFVMFAAPHVLFGWAALCLSVVLLKQMDRSVTSPRLLALVLTDVLLAVVFAAASLVLVFVLALVLDVSNVRRFGPEYEPRYTSLFIYSAALAKPLLRTALLVSGWPVLLHLLVAGCFWASKLFRPLVQRPTALLLLRFHQSEKGVLSSLAVGLGVLAKVAELSIKTLYRTSG